MDKARAIQPSLLLVNTTDYASTIQDTGISVDTVDNDRPTHATLTSDDTKD